MNLIAIAKALGVDDITSPTIPFVPPTGTVTGLPTTTDSPTTGASISLKADVTSIKKDTETDISVIIFSNSEEIKSLKFTVSYDPNIFEIVDGSDSEAGVQIHYLNSFFVTSKNSVDTVNGIITLEAGSQTGTATISNRTIAKIKVKALKDGIGEFRVVKDQSNLLKSDGTNILVQVQGVTLKVGEGQLTATPGVSTSVTGSTTGSPTGTDIQKPFDKTPDTALFDTPGSVSAVVGGLFLIVTGIYLYKKKGSHDLQR